MPAARRPIAPARLCRVSSAYGRRAALGWHVRLSHWRRRVEQSGPARDEGSTHRCSQLFSPRNLAWQEECFRIPTFAAKLERTKVLVPRPFRYVGLRLQPKAQSIQVFNLDVTVAHAVDQVLADGGGNSRPSFNLRHHSPKTNRPNSSPRAFTCAGSVAA